VASRQKGEINEEYLIGIFIVYILQ